MTTTKTGTRSRVPVARSGASKNGHYKTIKFRGLTLNLPGKTKLRLLKQMASGTNASMIEAIEALLGPDQMDQVWDLDVDLSKDGLDALGVMLGDLSLAVLQVYGTSAGELEAS